MSHLCTPFRRSILSQIDPYSELILTSSLTPTSDPSSTFCGYFSISHIPRYGSRSWFPAKTDLPGWTSKSRSTDTGLGLCKAGSQEERETRSIQLHPVFRPRQRAPRSRKSRKAPVAPCIAAHIVAQRPQCASFCSVGAHSPRADKICQTFWLQDQLLSFGPRSPGSGRRATWRRLSVSRAKYQLDDIPGGSRMATKNARDAAPDAVQPVSQRNRAALVEARRMVPGDTSHTRRDGLAQEMARFGDLAGIGGNDVQLSFPS